MRPRVGLEEYGGRRLMSDREAFRLFRYPLGQRRPPASTFLLRGEAFRVLESTGLMTQHVDPTNP